MTRRPRRLFWRVYAMGLAMVVLALVASSVAARAVEAVSQSTRSLDVDALSAELGPLDDRLPERLGAIASRHATELSIYRLDGTLAAATASGPRVTAEGVRELTGQLSAFSRSTRTRAVAIFDRGGRLAGLAVVPIRPLSWRDFRGLAAGLVVTFGALALVAFLFARTIARPVERITAAASELGAGTLTARANLTGSGEVVELGRTFDAMAAELERLLRGQQELVANVSHELRTPLARLQAALDLAGEGRPERQLPRMNRDVAELTRLVEDLLTVSRLSIADPRRPTGLPLLRTERTTAEALVAAAVERFRDRHPDRAIVSECAPGLPQLEVDSALVGRALDNLIDNARKYSDPGRDPIRLTARREGGTVELSIADRGIGIPAEAISRLGEPFFRTDESRSRESGGVGIGLTLVRRIAEAHRGTLAFESTPGAGTVARLGIPGARE